MARVVRLVCPPSPTHISRGDSPGPCNDRTGKKKTSPHLIPWRGILRVFGARRNVRLHLKTTGFVELHVRPAFDLVSRPVSDSGGGLSVRVLRVLVTLVLTGLPGNRTRYSRTRRRPADVRRKRFLRSANTTLVPFRHVRNPETEINRQNGTDYRDGDSKQV